VVRRKGRPGYDMETVLQISVGVFTERGFDGTSMNDLAAALGVSKSAIYHHVSSKEELLRIALDRALDGLHSVVTETEALQAPAVERLEFLVRGSVRVLLERLPYVTLLLRVRGNTLVERRALSRRRKFDSFTASLVNQAQEDGDVRPDIDAAVTARLLFGMVNSLSEWMRPGTQRDEDAIIDAICVIVFQGLRARDRAPDGAPADGRPG
jgi:AcrR family transcriptional regulator